MLRCLKPGHRAFKCRSKQECNICRSKNHHASTWVGSTGSEGGVALQTALAVMDDKKESRVRVLFDTGSQKSFITEGAVRKHRLRPVRKEELGIKVFGSTEADVAERDIVKLSLSPVNGGKKVFIEAFFVKDISSIPNVHIESIKFNYEHLKHIWFSDVSRHEDRFEIDCLVGSDWIWPFQEGGTIRGGNKNLLL